MFEGVEHVAYIKDISIGGALLLSTFIPPQDAKISISLETRLLDSPITLESKIVRRDFEVKDQDTLRWVCS